MRRIRRHLPVLNAALLLGVGLALGGGTLLHHVIPHHDADEETEEPTVFCSICKITESNPGDIVPDSAVQAVAETTFPAHPVLASPTGFDPAAASSPRAPPFSV